MATESKFTYQVIPFLNSVAYPQFVLSEVSDPDFVITETIEKGKFYYIKKVKSKLNLIKGDYQNIIDKFGQCYLYKVNVFKNCEEGQELILQCYFSDIHCDIDKDKCSMDVELQVDSPYNCIKQNGGNKKNILGPAPKNLGLEISPVVYRSLSLVDAILSINVAMNCCYETGCYVSVLSDFFNWQPDGVGGTIIPTNQPVISTNYVNPLQPTYYLRICAKSDVRNPNASNPATKLELSFNDIEQIMSEYLNCYWVIDYANGFPYIRWEHYSYYQRSMNYDTLTATNFPLNEYRNQVKLDSDEFPSSEKWLVEEASRIDFIGVPITYDSACTNGDQKDFGIKDCATDSDYIINTPASVANGGYLLVDCFETIPNTVWFVYSATGVLSLATQRNGRLSIANLQQDLFRHGRPLITGTMNNILQNFLSIEPHLLQDNMIVQNCCIDKFEKWKSSVRTEIGFGKIDEAEIDYTKEQIKFKLRHDSI